MNRHDQTTLIARLRDLPPPAVPPGLEARLLATLPSPEAAPTRSSSGRGRWRVMVVAVGALAAAVVIAVTLPRRATHPGPKTPSPDVSVEFVQHTNRSQETRPCDILPPLPSSSL